MVRLDKDPNALLYQDITINYIHILLICRSMQRYQLYIQIYRPSLVKSKQLEDSKGVNKSH